MSELLNVEAMANLTYGDLTPVTAPLLTVTMEKLQKDFPEKCGASPKAQVVVAKPDQPPAKKRGRPRKKSASDVDLARQCLEHLDPNCSYDQWLRVGMALHSVGDVLLPDWVAWSSGGLSYKEGEPEAKWASFASDRDNGITLASLIAMAVERGMEAPQKKLLPGTVDGRGWIVINQKDPIGIARTFIQRHWSGPAGPMLAHHSENWWTWDGIRWAVIEPAAITAKLVRMLDAAVDQQGNKIEASASLQNSVLKCLAGVAHVPAPTTQPGWLNSLADLPLVTADADPENLISYPGGIYDAVANATLIPTPGLWTCGGIDYLPFATIDGQTRWAETPQAWLDFLRSNIGDEESISLLQEWMGYSLVGDNSLQKMMLVVGPPRSGKGMIAHVLTKLVGGRTVAAPTMTSLGGAFGLSQLVGKTLAIVGDARFNAQDMNAIVEPLLTISGDGEITINQKYRDPARSSPNPAVNS